MVAARGARGGGASIAYSVGMALITERQLAFPWRSTSEAAAPAEVGRVTLGDTSIQYRVRRSARRRRTIEITVPSPGDVLVSAPVTASPERLRALVLHRAEWIMRHGGSADQRLSPRCFEDGETLPYLGREFPLRTRPQRGISIHGLPGRIEIRAPAALLELPADARRAALLPAVERWYHEQATEIVRARVAEFAPRLGVQPSAVVVRNQQRRWGSCSRSGVLRFNWRVVMAAPELLDYVVVHELAHLRVPGHSPGYWAQVARVLPDHRERRDALRVSSAAFEL